MIQVCSGAKWNACTPEERSNKFNYNLVIEENILDLSSAKYYDQLHRDPMGGKPEQDMLSNLLARTADVMLEYVVNNRTQYPGWRRPVFDLGPERLITVVFSALVESLYIKNQSSRNKTVNFLDGVKQQDIVRKIAKDVVAAAKYYSAVDQNRGAWVKANRILNKNWTKRNIQKFCKTHKHTEVNLSGDERIYLGLHMLAILEKTGIIRTEAPMVFNTFTQQLTEQKYVFFTDDVKDALILGHNHHIVNAHLRYMPMAVPPIKHSMSEAGGNYSTYLRKKIVKCAYYYYVDDEFHTEYKSSIPSEHTIKALNYLMSTEWTINSRVLEVMGTLVNNGGGRCNLPIMDMDPVLLSYNDTVDTTNLRAEAWSEWYQNSGKRWRIKTLLSIAKDFEALGFFYHSWACDFRGRMYPNSEMLSPQSGDWDKGLIMFANPVNQTEDGIRALKIQIANLFGHNKKTTEDRIRWVDDNMAMFKRINKDPLEHLSEWEDDSPKKNESFQRLASIFDLLRTDGLTQFPVSVDGTCNGYQHWTALMRDTEIAKLVNVSGQDVPADIYQVVADICTKSIIKCKNDRDILDICMTKWNNYVPRKLVKRAVMTDPYGVTAIGIRRGLMEEKNLAFVSPDKKKQDRACGVLTKIIRKAMEYLLDNPNNMKKWLKARAIEFAKTGKHPTWTTPSGFVVKNEYYSVDKKRVQIDNKEVRASSVIGQFTNEPDEYASQNSISPNYVHSLDASHMTEVINEMGDSGHTNFAFVHDSYGMDAPSVSRMQTVTREKFVGMYSVDLIANLKAEWEQQLGYTLEATPPLGDLDINCVLESEYFFS
jgi:DNA-directed RNA polymerase